MRVHQLNNKQGRDNPPSDNQTKASNPNWTIRISGASEDVPILPFPKMIVKMRTKDACFCFVEASKAIGRGSTFLFACGSSSPEYRKMIEEWVGRYR